MKPGSFNRKGFTLAELAVVLALAGVAGSAIGLTLVRQQRFYRGATEQLHARAEVRDALDVVATDIRGLSPADTVRLMADSAFEFFAAIGVGVACGNETANAVRLAASLPRGNTLTAFLAQPDSGDIALFLLNTASRGWQWERHRIAGLATSQVTGCPPQMASPGGGIRTGQPAGEYLLTLQEPPGVEVKVGTPVRFVRSGRYSLYRSGDGEWYLGFRRCGASGCSPIQPLSGPYRPYSADPGVTGLLFEYFDKAGVRLVAGSSALALARVDVTVRSESRQRILLEGRHRRFADSAKVSVAVRNALE